MNVEPRKIPEHQAIYERLRDAILFGELVPGQSVTIQGLTKQIDAGMTPVREAIRRLLSEGALQGLGNRRVVVPSLDESQLVDLRFARLSIEPELARRAALSGDKALLSDLRAVDAMLDDAIASGSVQDYLLHNYRFHFRMYQAAGAPILQDLAASLWLRSGPSSRVVCGRFGTTNLPDMHDQMMDALACGDVAGVARAMAEDIEQGLNMIQRSLEQDGDQQGN